MIIIDMFCVISAFCHSLLSQKGPEKMKISSYCLKGGIAALAIAAFTLTSAEQALANNGNGAGAAGNASGARNSDRADSVGAAGGAGNANNAAGAGQAAQAGAANGRNTAAERRETATNRGDIASALGALNAANASQTALENAAPDSMPGRLYAYQQTGGITAAGVFAFNEAQQITALTPEALLAAYDADGDGVLSPEEQAAYDADLAEATATIETLLAAYAALGAMSDADGLQLSAAALAELNALLGL